MCDHQKTALFPCKMNGVVYNAVHVELSYCSTYPFSLVAISSSSLTFNFSLVAISSFSLTFNFSRVAISFFCLTFTSGPVASDDDR